MAAREVEPVAGDRRVPRSRRALRGSDRARWRQSRRRARSVARTHRRERRRQDVLAEGPRPTGGVRGRDPRRGSRRRRSSLVASSPSSSPTCPRSRSSRRRCARLTTWRSVDCPTSATSAPRDRTIATDRLELLERLSLGSMATRHLSTMSGGELQRLVLARALAQEAPVLLLDEPTSALDLGRRVEALELVDELRIERGLTVISAMHDLTLAAQFADELALLASGAHRRDGQRRRSARRRLARFSLRHPRAHSSNRRR